MMDLAETFARKRAAPLDEGIQIALGSARRIRIGIALSYVPFACRFGWHRWTLFEVVNYARRFPVAINVGHGWKITSHADEWFLGCTRCAARMPARAPRAAP